MTARDSFDSPDGRTYSGPADAATPGQAALQNGEIVYLYHWRFERGEEFGLYRHAADADAMAAKRADEGLSEVLSMAILDRPQAIAAREPHAADGNAPELRITDCSAHGDALHIQVNTGHNWLCAVALTAILAEYEPQPDVQPAPGPANAFRGPADAVRMMLDMPSAHPQPAPELAAAMAESRTLRTDLDEATGFMLAHHDGAVQRRARILRKRAGLPVEAHGIPGEPGHGLAATKPDLRAKLDER